MPLEWQLPGKPGILQGQDVVWKQTSPFRSAATHMLAPLAGQAPSPGCLRLLLIDDSTGHPRALGSAELHTLLSPPSFAGHEPMLCNGLTTWNPVINWPRWYNMLCSFVLISQHVWEQVLLASTLNLILLVLKVLWNLLCNFCVSILCYGWSLCPPVGTVDNGPKVLIRHKIRYPTSNRNNWSQSILHDLEERPLTPITSFSSFHKHLSVQHVMH